MLKVYFIDDDPLILEELESIIDYSKYGYEIVGRNTDSVKAEEEIAYLKPNLVITDVQMKKLNGFELVEKLNPFLKNTTFVFLSVFDKFDYAVEAMRLGAIRYLKKPVIKKELIECLEQVKNKMSEKFSNDVLHALTNENFEMSEVFASSSLIDHSSPYRLMYLNGGEGHKQVIEELIDYCSSFQVIYSDEVMTALILFNFKMNPFNSFMRENHKDISVALSPQFLANTFDEIGEWYRRCRIGSKQKFITGEAEFVIVSDKDSSSELCSVILDTNQIYPFHDLVSKLPEYALKYNLQVYDLQKVYRAILLNMLKLKITEYDENLFSYSVIDYYDSIKEMSDDLSYYFVSDFQTDINEEIIKEVRQYLEENLSKKISLAYFAKRYSYNLSYFSQLFKRLVGMSFVEYLISLKMDKAKYLIANTDDDFQNIAIDVGYSDYYHFSKTFKKYTSYTPTDFRALFSNEQKPKN